MFSTFWFKCFYWLLWVTTTYYFNFYVNFHGNFFINSDWHYYSNLFEEYAWKNSRLVALIQFSTNALVATPSIVFSIFGYVVIVVGLRLGHNFWSAGLMFFIMTLPIIIRVVEHALHYVPQEYRDAALALRTSKIGMVCKVVLPNARG
ncbi:ABC transporter permease subunit [Spiroplasma endosymbiont of Poecilobothrus nobilitatus]|uniref:ABC transporter permease subunit n=1 Tax=Spiroplasma endosymbiont of Poecilobothrus nobilitatus TaxID=1209220 RepID=UPI003CC7A7DA